MNVSWLIVEGRPTQDGRVIGYQETTWARPHADGVCEQEPPLDLPVFRDGERVGTITELERIGHVIVAVHDAVLADDERLCADTTVERIAIEGDDLHHLSAVRVRGATICP